MKILPLFVFFVKVATNLKSMDTNKANAPYVFTLLWAFPKPFVALLFIYLFIGLQPRSFFADGIRMLVNLYTVMH